MHIPSRRDKFKLEKIVMAIRIKVILLLIFLAFTGFFFYKGTSNKIGTPSGENTKLQERETATLTSINEMLYNRKSKDAVMLDKLKSNVENIFTEQLLGSVEIEPVCVDSVIGTVEGWVSDKSTNLKSVNRLDGFIDEITSVCYQTQIVYLTGKETAGTITDEDINTFTDEVWTKYFCSEDQIKIKIEEAVNEFISEVEDNHTSLFTEIQNKYDINIKQSLTANGTNSNLPSLNEFIKDQSGYSVATTIGAMIAGKQMGDLSKVLVQRLGKATTKVKGNNWKSAIAGVALAGLTEMFIYNRSSDELKNGIRDQMERMKKTVLYGDDNKSGIIDSLSKILEKYQNEEKDKVLSGLNLSS